MPVATAGLAVHVEAVRYNQRKLVLSPCHRHVQQAPLFFDVVGVARIAWAVLAKGRGFEATRKETSRNPRKPGSVLDLVKTGQETPSQAFRAGAMIGKWRPFRPSCRATAVHSV